MSTKHYNEVSLFYRENVAKAVTRHASAGALITMPVLNCMSKNTSELLLSIVMSLGCTHLSSCTDVGGNAHCTSVPKWIFTYSNGVVCCFKNRNPIALIFRKIYRFKFYVIK